VQPRSSLHQVTGSALPRAAHASHPHARTDLLMIGIVISVAMITAAGLAAAVLLKPGGKSPRTPSSAQLITVTAVTTPARP